MMNICINLFCSKPNSLKEGTLYVADNLKGKWLALDWENQSILKK